MPDTHRFALDCRVYHLPTLRTQGAPQSLAARAFRWLSSNEQAYSRQIVVESEWKPLDMGWIERAASVAMHHLPTQWQRNPTPTEAAEDAQRVVEVDCGGGIWLLWPGEMLHGCTRSRVRLRCQNGTARVQILIIPE